MEDFYFYSSVIALVVLLVILTMIGIIISKGNKSKTYPPVQNECPDYWEQGAKGTLIDGKTPGSTVVTDYCKYPGSDKTNSGNKPFSSGLKDTTAGPNSANWNPIVNSIGGVTVKNSSGVDEFYIQLQNNDAKWTTMYPKLSVRCAKRKWANDNGIVWDGVTNYNGCA